jgi:hypothetical protein
MFDLVSRGIIGDDNESPLYNAISKNIDLNKVPPLKNWSDAVALHWKKEAGDTKDLHWILRAHVVNEDT